MIFNYDLKFLTSFNLVFQSHKFDFHIFIYILSCNRFQIQQTNAVLFAWCCVFVWSQLAQ